MKDESLREALRQATRHEPSLGDPFSRFERVRRRNALARGVVLVGVGAALMLAFAFVFPNPLRSGPPAEFPTGGDLDPQTSPVRIYEDPVAGYALEYPAEWKVRGAFGERVTFYVDTVPPLGNAAVADLFERDGYELEVPKTFFVQVTPLTDGNEPRAVDRSRLKALSNAGAIVTTAPIFAEEDGQRRDEQLRVFYGPQPFGQSFARRVATWCQSCRVEEVTVVLVPDRGVPPLHIRIVAPSNETYQDFRFDAVEILNSIERYLAR